MTSPKRWEKLDLTLVVRVAKMGSGYYLRIPGEIVGALGLMSKDTLQIRIEAVKREVRNIV